LALLKTEKGWQNGTAHARKILAAVEMGAALAKRLALEANEGR
jgi:hypothetical protein